MANTALLRSSTAAYTVEPRRPTAAAVVKRRPAPATSSNVRRARRACGLRARASVQEPGQDKSSTTEVGTRFSVQLPAAEAIKTSVDGFFQRYDVVSAGMGSLVVTSICVKNGQDPFTALWITAASTVAALVLHELWFGNERQEL